MVDNIDASKQDALDYLEGLLTKPSMSEKEEDILTRLREMVEDHWYE